MKRALNNEDPASLESEVNLLSSCMLDGREVIGHCLDADITPDSFYLPAHGQVYRSLLSLYYDDKPTTSDVVALDLKERGVLESVGGFAFVTDVSSKVPTTAEANHFIGVVREKSTLRTLRAKAMGVLESIDKGTTSTEVLDLFEAELSSVRNRVMTANLRDLGAFGLPAEDGPDELIGQNRYICKGDSCLIVSSSGMGKSSLQMIWAARIALGRPCLGIETKRGETSLIIQAEDSDGDIGELWFSIKHTMQLTDEEIKIVRKRVIVVRDKVNRGAKFIASMRALIAKVKPAFVWLNPLHAFAGCDIANAQEMGNFLREGLNKANRDESYAYMIIHHTPKPMTGKAVADKKWHEFMYDAAGSAELVNWARAVITLKPTDVEGDFNLVLAKRGKRAGVRLEVEGEATTFLEITTKIPIRQSNRTLRIEGRKRPFHLLDWTVREKDPEPEAKAPGNKHVSGGSYKSQFDDGEVLTYFPSSKAAGEGITSISKDLKLGIGMSTSNTMQKIRPRFLEDGFITKLPDATYRRTLRGDTKADEYAERMRQPAEIEEEDSGEQIEFIKP